MGISEVEPAELAEIAQVFSPRSLRSLRCILLNGGKLRYTLLEEGFLVERLAKRS